METNPKTKREINPFWQCVLGIFVMYGIYSLAVTGIEAWERVKIQEIQCQKFKHAEPSIG